VPSLSGRTRAVLVGNKHTWLIRCGSAARLLSAHPASCTGARGAGGPSTRPPEDKDPAAEEWPPAAGPPRRRRSQDNVGEPVPVCLDARMTAAATHDEQFVGQYLERGVQEEQEARCLYPAEIERLGGRVHRSLEDG
jgi:LmbE family N-acetylglucosaminyl deacetylase